jgi:hypothetical protein
MYVNRICGVMVSVLALSVVDRGLESRSGQTKDYIKLVFVAFSVKHAVLGRNQDEHATYYTTDVVKSILEKRTERRGIAFKNFL